MVVVSRLTKVVTISGNAFAYGWDPCMMTGGERSPADILRLDELTAKWIWAQHNLGAGMSSKIAGTRRIHRSHTCPWPMFAQK